jgi:NADH-quinone oxidoreductase subunit F
VAHVSRGEYTEAYKVIRDANPFPSACARVCNHPCEHVCRAGATGGQPIAIRTLKRYVVDNVAPLGRQKPAVHPNAARIAIIGAGPAGMTAANALSLLGHKVTVFEKEKIAGGMLVSAIPEYRLPKETIAKEIDSLLNDNIEMRYQQVLGSDFTVDSLQKDGYKAVFIATGSHQSKKLGLPGDEVEGIIPGIKFLKAFNLEGKSLAKGRVGIVGGGNSAMDAARIAIRQPGVESVTIFYRRTQDTMPAYKEEIEAGLAEGVVIEELVAPVSVESKDGKLAGIQFIRNTLGARDASGRGRPVPVKGSEFVASLDTLIVSISEEPENVGTEGIDRTSWGTIAINPESRLTNKPGVFAGGDIVTGPNTVIESIAAGKQTAIMIERYLTGKLMKTLPKVKLPTVYVAPVTTEEDENSEVVRIEMPLLPVAQRKVCFKEVDLCPTEQQVLTEARRCARCDLDFTQTH